MCNATHVPSMRQELPRPTLLNAADVCCHPRAPAREVAPDAPRGRGARLTIGQGVRTWRRREIAEKAEEHRQERCVDESNTHPHHRRPVPAGCRWVAAGCIRLQVNYFAGEPTVTSRN